MYNNYKLQLHFKITKMENKRFKQIEKSFNSLIYFFFGKFFYEQFSTFDQMAFRGYARLGKEKFMKEIPIEEIMNEFQSLIKKNEKLAGFKELLDDQQGIKMYKKLLYSFSLAEENKELLNIHLFIKDNEKEIREWQKKSLKLLKSTISKDKSKKFSKKLKNIDTVEFIETLINSEDSMNYLGKALTYGIDNNFFTKEEIALYYKEYLFKWLKSK